jgi:16S rRNA (guanine527-N7)-methyltransferase
VDASAAGLSQRLAAAAVAVDTEACRGLLDVLRAAAAEEQNLTSITDPVEALERHLVDSLLAAALPAVHGSHGPIADVGSGIGFPGLALAAIFPDRAVHLVESEQRKAAWLTRAARNFPNVRVVPERSEDLAHHARGAFALVVARALGPAPVALELCAPLVADDGHVVLWRAGEPDLSADAAADILGFSPAAIRPCAPFPGAERHFATYRRREPTPPRFPRRPGRAAKQPLT